MPRYCRGEHARFPDAAFSAVAAVGLVHMHDLPPGTLPHTVLGEPLPSEAPDPSSEEARTVHSRIRRGRGKR